MLTAKPTLACEQQEYYRVDVDDAINTRGIKPQ